MGYLTAILAAVIWGLVYAIREKTLPFISPLGMMFVNSLVMLAVTLPLLLANRSHFNQLMAARWSDIGLIVFAALTMVLGTWLLFFSIEKMGASTAAMIEIAYPLFVVLFCWLLSGTAVGWPVMVGGLLIFAGSAVIVVFGRQ